MRFAFFVCIFPFIALAQHNTYQVPADTTAPRELIIDQKKLDVSLTFEPEKGLVKGLATIVFEPLTNEVDSIWLDGVKLNYEAVLYDGATPTYNVYEKGIAIFPDTVPQLRTHHEIEIRYAATPTRGIFFMGWEDKTNTAPKQIWTQGQGIDHRHWIPHVDAQNDKLITSLTVSFDTAYQVISNGILKNYMSVENIGHWHYTMDKPHSSYLIMLAVGRYADFKEQSHSGIELTNYYYPNWAERNPYTYFQSTSVFDFLEAEIGVPFPWQNYKQVPVMNFQHGAMENTGATIFGDFFCVDSISFNDRNYVGVNAHELAHQWFGNLVTATHSTHHWLHEGFATYYAWLVEKEVFGDDRFAVLRKESLERVITVEAQNNFPLAHTQAGSERFYDKGAWVLYMLRNEVGDTAWRAAIKSYLTKYQFELAQSDFLKEEMELASGKDLDWFFEQWVYQTGIPDLRFEVSEKNSQINIVVSQNLIGGQPPFKLRIPLHIVTSNGGRDEVLLVEGQAANFSFTLEKREKLLAIIPDKDFELPATWALEMDAELNLAAAGSSFHWFFAAEALQREPELFAELAQKMLYASLLNRIAFAEVLAKHLTLGKPVQKSELNFLAQETNMEVMKAFLRNTNLLQNELEPLVLQWLSLPSYDLVEQALIRLCVSNKTNAKKYLDATDVIMGTSGHNVRITWLLLYGAFVSSDRISEITDYMSPAYDFLTRMNAFAVASQLDYCNYKVADHAFSTLFQYNRKLRGAGRDFIKNMSQKAEHKKSFQLWVNRNRNLLSPDALETIKRMTGFEPEG